MVYDLQVKMLKSSWVLSATLFLDHEKDLHPNVQVCQTIVLHDLFLASLEFLAIKTKQNEKE